MLLTLEVLPALEGDCLLLHWGTRASPRLAVIDGGPARVFDDTLLPRLEQIRADRNLDRLTLDLVMVSHVDNDHVVGIKKLFSMLARWQERHAPQDERTLQVSRLWHNTFNDILGDGADAYYRTLTASFQASIGGGPNPAIVTELERRLLAAAGADPGTARHAARDVAGVLAGHGEGRDVRVSYELLRDARQISRLNAPFEKDGRATLLTAAATPNARAIDGLGMQILGPLDTDVAALQKSFDAYIDERGLTAEATLAAYADRSVPNLSSIVCLAEAGGKRLLLTGDARGDKIIEGLRSAHLLDGEGRLDVDVLKVPHHGSARNLAPDFFNAVRATTYVFSANGKHGNPDREALEWLIDARGRDARYTIVLTYPVAEIDRLREVSCRGNWNVERDSLAALFAARSGQGFRFVLVENAPYRIELGDETIDW